MREIFIDVENGSNNTIKVTQGDNLTESYKLIITENKIRLDLTNKKVKFAFVKSDSHYGDIIEELKILNAIEGEVEFEVVNRITKVDGLYSCGLAVYDDKGFLEHTGTFSLYVRESIFEKVSGELIKNSAYKELISLLDRATNLNKEIDPIVINAEEKTNTLKENIKVADNSNKTLVDNTEKANTLNNTLVENTNEAKKTNENAVIKDNTLKETIKVAEANNNKLIHTNDSAKEINNTLVKNMNEVKEVNENAINIKTSLENNINQATNLKSDLETEINKSVLANSTLIKSIDNATETNKDFINKDSNLKETIKNAENINEELSENENKATLNEATRKKNEAERIEAEKIREEKIEQFGSQVTKNKNDIADNSKDIERAFETINDNSFIPFEGESVTVEHSKVGFIKDMRIKGRTLFKKADGSYIEEFEEGCTLSSSCEKENKIISLSHGKNIINENDFTNEFTTIENGKIRYKNVSSISATSEHVNIYLNEGEYTISFNNLEGNYKNLLLAYKIDEEMRYINSNTRRTTIRINKHSKITFYFTSEDTTQNVDALFNFMVTKGVDEQYEPYKQNKKEILIPYENGLKGLLNRVCDEIVNNKVIQRVEKTVLNGVENITLSGQQSEGFLTVKILNTKVVESGQVICNKFIRNNNTWQPQFQQEGIQTVKYSANEGYIFIKIRLNKLETPDVAGFKKWLQSNPVTVYYELAEPVEHKIADLNSINLETFKDVTYVSSKNEIQPHLSFKAPVDIPKTISSLRNANTMLIAQNVGLENKNTELEKVNNQQNKALKELNDTTSFLIEDSLSK